MIIPVSLLAVIMVTTQWAFVTSRYVPSSGNSRSWHTARHNTQRPWQSERRLPSQTWSQRLYEQSSRNRVATESLRTLPNFPIQRQRQSRTAPLESRNRLYLYRSHNQNPVSLRRPSSTVQANYHISVSNDDTDHSRITFRTTQIRHGTARQNRRSNIQRHLPNRNMNSDLNERGNFLGHRARNIRRPLHNIVFRTITGRTIKILHSLGKTNIILNTKSAPKHRNAMSNIHPEQKKVPITKSIVGNLPQHEKLAAVDLKNFNGSNLAIDHVTSLSATSIMTDSTSMEGTHLANIIQHSNTELMSTRNPSRHTKPVDTPKKTLVTIHPENVNTTNSTAVRGYTTTSSNLQQTGGTVKSVSVTSIGLDSMQQNSHKNTIISKASNKFSQIDDSILDDVSHENGRPEAPAEDIDGIDTPDSSDPTDK